MNTFSKYFFAFLILFSSSLASVAQRSMTFDDLTDWRRISGYSLSDDGKWVGCKMEPWVGDASVHLFDAKGNEVVIYQPATKYEFSPSSNYFIASLTTAKTVADSLKLAKVKEKKMPMDRLVIRGNSGSEQVIDSLKNYKLAGKGDWIAYQQGRKDSTLYISSLDGSRMYQYPAVKEYRFAKKSSTLYYVTAGDTLGTEAGLYVLDPERGTPSLVKEGKGVFKQVSFDDAGGKLAFLYCQHKDSTDRAFSLWMSEGQAPARMIANRGNRAFPSGWVISGNGRINFSEDGRRLFFGTAPEPRQRDTTMLAENRALVQIWNWDEHTPYTVQHHDKKNDLKKSYRAVYNLPSAELLQLATVEYPDLAVGNEGNAEIALLASTLPYPTVAMWEGAQKRDYQAVSLVTGQKRTIKQGINDRLRLSPEGKYAYWYATGDSCWYAVSMNDGKEYRLTTPDTFVAWDEENDVPSNPGAYGTAGWTAGDERILLYDRYDIWSVDPTGTAPMVNLTRNGREQQLRYRLLQLDEEAKFVDLNKDQILHAFNEQTKGTGFYTARLSKPGAPKTLLVGNSMLRGLKKAKDANRMVYTSETFADYPDMYLTDANFKKPLQLTHGDRQRDGITWGTAELISWMSLDGIPLQGVVYKPANFDPTRKYPMIVNFYERNSDGLYGYHTPEPHRSTIDYHLYTSNGYVIFNPDVVYKTGYPGESCFNAVMPGISRVVAEGYIDEKTIGAQGHSWGGYQVAYLATRTNLFAAIESGAPVVNMFSAYGGIRWGSGRSRSFQYEMGQSRIGESPWQAPLKYMENSPLFTMDKVQTPILIMHNDQDGHVPWYQGIEYFLALKRLQKPAWLLNYTGEIHWPERIANRIDFQKRMFQFFNHYLKEEPMPKWMKDGVPAVDQEFELGLEF